ncbi:HAAS signaling domain-containing protein [Halobacillus seohaensis]|uniref:HAAS domain-containing protein n=1 Tax=Halobacillus seohaensis TaxID=447421 RepID=A0ABW2EIX1_9BACI
MNKEQFLKKLSTSLRRLSEDEREDILQDFQEHFDIGKEEGETEEEISKSLGSPTQIAKELLASYYLEKVEDTSTTGNVLRAVWAVIGLGFFNLVIVLGPFIAVVAVVLAGWVSGLAFIVSPLLVLVNLAIYPGTFELFDLFFSITLTGLGLIIAIGMLFVTRFITTGLVRYLNYNVRLVKGGLNHE